MRRHLAAIALVTLLLLCGAPIARAEPISIALLTTVGISATATAVSLTTFALTVGAGIGLSYLQSAFKKSAGAQTSTPIGGHSGRIAAGGTVPRACGVGDYMTAGSLAYVNSFGEDGKTPNAFLVYVIALSDLPVAGLKGFWVNGARVTLGAETSNAGYAVPEFTNAAGDHLWVKFYDGTQTEADARLVEMFGGHAERPYSDRRIGLGVAYAIITVRVNPELFSGFPQFKFELEGIPLYDRRYDSTAGGDGDQRYDDPGTWLPSANPAVIRWNILRGLRYAGQWQWGGQTITEAQLPDSSWFAAMNECDAMVDLAEGGQEAQFKAGGEIVFGVKPIEVLRELLKADNGRLAEIGGIYKTRSGAPGAAVFAFTDRDILSSAPQTFEPIAALDAKINYVAGRYISRAEGWTLKDAPALVDADLEARDGRRHAASADYGFVTSPTQVQRLMRAERDSNRAWRRHALPMPPEAFVLEPLDVVSWNSERNGYDDKALEIVEVEDLPTFDVGIAIKELDGAAYNWDPNTDERTVSEGTITILRPEAQPVVDWYVEPYTFKSGGVARAGVLFGWDPDQDDVDGIRVQVQLRATEELQLDTEEGSQVFARGALAVSQNLIGNTQYQGRLQYRPASAREALWTSWRDVTTDDVRVTAREIGLEVLDMIQKFNSRIDSIEDKVGAVVGRAQILQADELLEKSGQIGGLAAAVTGESSEYAGKQTLAYVADQKATEAGEVASEVAQDFGVFISDEGTFGIFRTNVKSALTGTSPTFDGVVTLASDISQQFITLAAPDQTFAIALLNLKSALTGDSTTFGGETTLASEIEQSFVTLADPGGTYGQAILNLKAAITGAADTLGGTATLAASLRNALTVAAGPGYNYSQAINELIAAIDGSSSSIYGEQTAAYSIEQGFAALWTLKVEVDAYGNKNVAAIQLGADEEESAIRMSADNFLFVLEGYDDVGLVLGSIDGVTKLGFNGDEVLFDSSVVANNIETGAINSDLISIGGVDILNIIDGAVSNETYFSTSSLSGHSGGDTTLGSGSITIKSGRAAEVLWSTSQISASGGSADNTFRIKIKIDGSTVKTFTWAVMGRNSVNANVFVAPVSISYPATSLSAGSHTFAIVAEASSGGSTMNVNAGEATVRQVHR